MTDVITPAATRSPSLFWRFWTATAISGAGSAVTLVALPLVAVSVLDASVTQVSLLAAAGQVGWLVLGLPAGVIAQRCPLRTLQVATDLIRLIALASIPLAWWLAQLTYAHLVVAALAVGLATVVFDVANATFLPAIIDTKDLTARNGLMSSTLAVTQTGGPSLGGLLVQLSGPVGALCVDAVSYLLSALTLRTLPHAPPVAPAPTARAPFTRQIREGWQFVVRHPVMMPCMWWATATNFAAGALLALTPTYLVREAHLSPFMVGLLIAADGLGALAGSLAAARLAARFGTARIMIAASLTGAVLALAMPLTAGPSSAVLFAVGNAGFNAGVVIGSIVTRTHRQTHTPPHLLSRVMATVRFVSWGASPLGAALSGLAAATAGVRPALWLVCACAFAGPAILLTSRIRGLRDLSQHTEPHPKAPAAAH
ncbi:MFS transporter [Streptomyces resistomycificus]|uniref:MFS transporter n=1 Tax=Streptomyces resistomycificus TaxID=67356 RepID=A0A0L8L3D5_9ACTN|nr:MFS transporter [Streptomyces resistomycificus]KOG32604.1 MFS transporter [Streptomyces resistomycificus]KUN90538.1 MFS transporter [Streptomyces resistomycificus]